MTLQLLCVSEPQPWLCVAETQIYMRTQSEMLLLQICTHFPQTFLTVINIASLNLYNFEKIDACCAPLISFVTLAHWLFPSSTSWICVLLNKKCCPALQCSHWREKR